MKPSSATPPSSTTHRVGIALTMADIDHYEKTGEYPSAMNAWAFRYAISEMARVAFARSESVRNEWRDLAHEAFLQLEYLHQRERQHGSTGAILLRLSEKLGLPLDTPVSATAKPVPLDTVKASCACAWPDECGEAGECLRAMKVKP